LKDLQELQPKNVPLQNFGNGVLYKGSKKLYVLLTVHLEYNRVKKNQLDAQLIISIFRQPLHVSGVSRSIIRSYDRIYTIIGLLSWLDQDNRQSSKQNNKYQLLYTYGFTSWWWA